MNSPKNRMLMLAAVALGGASASSTMADSFSYTGPLISARHYHSSVLLPNGKVLVAAGQDSGEAAPKTLTSAELYNPATGKWAATGSLTTGRKYQTTSLLSDGRVLLTGGSSFPPVVPPMPALPAITLSDAEIYNPTTGIWSNAGFMMTERDSHTATLLPDGRVLVVGGYRVAQQVAARFLASAELYDPADGSWTQTGSLNIPRFAHTATLLPDGKVMVAGGANVEYLSSVEIYDPATETWTLGQPLLSARWYHTATLLNNGQVLVTAGENADGTMRTCELYDPVTGVWTPTGLADAREHHTATLMPDGRVFIMGGSSSAGVWLKTTKFYDPLLGTWSPGPAMLVPRYGNSATLLPNGTVLVAGGFNVSSLASAELFKPTISPYSTWKSLYFGAGASDPAIAGDMVDGDLDEIPNIMEFALNGNPTVPDPAILPVVGFGADALELHFTRPAPADVIYNVQASTDLITWTTVATLAANSDTWTGNALVTELSNGATRSVTVQYSAPPQFTPVHFLRLAVSR